MVEIEKRQLAKLIKNGEIENITACPVDKTCYALTCNADEIILVSAREGVRRFTLKSFAYNLKALGWNQGFHVAAEPVNVSRHIETT